jgi:hypothetical protein
LGYWQAQAEEHLIRSWTTYLTSTSIKDEIQIRYRRLEK